MATFRGQRPKQKREAKKAAGRGKTWSYAIRLDEAERKLLFDAAEVKGWSPTSLIKQATVEKAAHIVNVGRKNKFDFEAIASDLATRLCVEPTVKVEQDGHVLGEEDWGNVRIEKEEDEDGFVDELKAWCEQKPMKDQDVALLRDASHYGGSEFYAKVLDKCDRICSKGRGHLPPPIDPASLLAAPSIDDETSNKRKNTKRS